MAMACFFLLSVRFMLMPAIWTWRRHNMKTLSTVFAVYGDPFVVYAEIWCLYCSPEQAAWQTVALSMISDSIMLIYKYNLMKCDWIMGKFKTYILTNWCMINVHDSCMPSLPGVLISEDVMIWNIHMEYLYNIYIYDHCRSFVSESTSMFSSQKASNVDVCFLICKPEHAIRHTVELSVISSTMTKMQITKLIKHTIFVWIHFENKVFAFGHRYWLFDLNCIFCRLPW